MYPDDMSIEHAYDFMGEHDSPTPEEIRRLAEEQSPEAFEMLNILAERYNLDNDPGLTADELADRIILAMDKEADNEQLG